MFETQPKHVALLGFGVFLCGFTTAAAQPSLPPLQGPNGNIYQVAYEPGLTWTQANRLAQTMTIGTLRGHLATITSREEDLFIELELGSQTRLNALWIGGFQELNQPHPWVGWKWVNDEGLIPESNDGPGYANWERGNPTDGDIFKLRELNVVNFLAVRWDPREGEYDWMETHGFADFDGFVVEYETGVGPMPDCNQNGIHDAIDLVTGSEDENGDGIPDECAISFQLVEAEESCVTVMATSLIPMKGGEIGIAYDPEVVSPACAEPGTDFPGDSGNIFCDLNPTINCQPEEDVLAGITVGWVNSGTGAILPPGTYELLKICFARSSSGQGGPCSPLRFVDCLGVPEAPVRNSVTDENNESVPALHTDSEVCPGETIFRRGDVDADGVFNISDPIFLLSCLFLGTACPTCPDAADSNDDGALDIADGTFLLSWRFLGGAQPPPPFPGCGLDLTSDALGDCIFDSEACF